MSRLWLRVVLEDDMASSHVLGVRLCCSAGSVCYSKIKIGLQIETGLVLV